MTDYETLSQAVERAEREDPVVAKAAQRFDDAMDELRYRAELAQFRPLPWDTYVL